MSDLTFGPLAMTLVFLRPRRVAHLNRNPVRAPKLLRRTGTIQVSLLLGAKHSWSPAANGRLYIGYYPRQVPLVQITEPVPETTAASPGHWKRTTTPKIMPTSHKPVLFQPPSDSGDHANLVPRVVIYPVPWPKDNDCRRRQHAHKRPG